MDAFLLSAVAAADALVALALAKGESDNVKVIVLRTSLDDVSRA